MTTARLTRRTCLAALGSAALLAGATRRSHASAADWTELELLDQDDRVIRLGDTAYSHTLIQLWASWCPICLSELSAMSDAAAALRHDGIDILLVSSPAGWAADTRLASTRVPGLRRARPSGRNTSAAMRRTLFSSEGWYYVPRSLLYDRRAGVITWRHLGPVDWRAAPWRAHEAGRAGV